MGLAQGEAADPWEVIHTHMPREKWQEGSQGRVVVSPGKEPQPWGRQGKSWVSGRELSGDRGFRDSRSLVKVVYPRARDLEASKEKSGPAMRKINYKLGLQFQGAGGREAGRGMLVQQSLPQHGPYKGQIFPQDPRWSPSRGRNGLGPSRRHCWG